MLDRRMFVAAGAAAAASPAIAVKRSEASFPKGFLWGAATSPFQIEGNNINSDAWLMENVSPTAFAEPSGDATSSFHMWPADMDLCRKLNFGA